MVFMKLFKSKFNIRGTRPNSVITGANNNCTLFRLILDVRALLLESGVRLLRQTPTPTPHPYSITQTEC